jgi:hypothetical protein
MTEWGEVRRAREMENLSRNPLPTAWGEVLENVQRALTEALEEATRREQAIPSVDPPTDREAGWRMGLDRLEDRVGELRACGQRAEQIAAEAGAALKEGEEELRAWLAAAAECGRNPVT